MWRQRFICCKLRERAGMRRQVAEWRVLTCRHRWSSSALLRKDLPVDLFLISGTDDLKGGFRLFPAHMTRGADKFRKLGLIGRRGLKEPVGHLIDHTDTIIPDVVRGGKGIILEGKMTDELNKTLLKII